MKKFLVTGGAGFIGSHIVDALINEGNEVRIVDNLSSGFSQNVNPKAELINVDISKRSARYELCSAMSEVDTVFHTAAKARVQPSIEDPQTYHNTNVNGTFNILMSAKESGVKRVVYSASSSAYGDINKPPLKENMPTDPMSPYALQKLIGEQYCTMFSKVYGLETVNLRYFNIYGERQVIDGGYATVIGIFLKQRSLNEKLTITNDGNQTRDFTYVKDVVAANLAASTSDKVGNGEVINIGRGENYSVNDVADIIGGEKEYIGDRLEPTETLADNSLAKELLGWEPRANVKDWLATA